MNDLRWTTRSTWKRTNQQKFIVRLADSPLLMRTIDYWGDIALHIPFRFVQACSFGHASIGRPGRGVASCCSCVGAGYSTREHARTAHIVAPSSDTSSSSAFHPPFAGFYLSGSWSAASLLMSAWVVQEDFHLLIFLRSPLHVSSSRMPGFLATRALAFLLLTNASAARIARERHRQVRFIATGCSTNASSVASSEAPPPAPPKLTFDSAESVLVEWLPDCSSESFQLLSDDWWLSQTSVDKLVYSGSDVTKTLTAEELHLLPGAPVTLALVASSAVEGERRSDPVTASAPEQGRCGNPTDIAVWRGARLKLKDGTTNCLSQCSTARNGEACTAECVKEEIGEFSDSCTGCFSELFACAFRHCGFICSLNKGARCDDCVTKACEGGAVSCTGVPTWAFSAQ